MDFGYVSLELAPWIRSGLRLGHFAGIILGVGAATLLDLIILRFVLTRRIDQAHIHIIIFAAGVITAGLVLLWISGIGFFVYYWFFDPDKMHNPKLVAKIIIVGVLTANAFLVNLFVLPQVKVQIGQRLLDGLSMRHCVFLVLIGTVSAISWVVPVILGVVPQLNGTIPAWVILASYAVLVLSANIIIGIVLIMLPHQHRRGFGVRGF